MPIIVALRHEKRELIHRAVFTTLALFPRLGPVDRSAVERRRDLKLSVDHPQTSSDARAQGEGR